MVLGRINKVVVDLVSNGVRVFAPEALPEYDWEAGLEGDETGVPLDPYREFLDVVVERGGGRALLKAGQALDALSDPLLFVLLNSDSVPLLIEKEGRLSRFIHSRHTVRILESDKDSVVLGHASAGDEAPRRTEDLAGCGQHISLLKQIGCVGLQLQFPGSEVPDRIVFDGTSYHEPPPGDCSHWKFVWTEFTPTRRPMPGLDEVLLNQESRPQLEESSPTVTLIERVAEKDLGRTWTLREVAAKLDTSSRSLQRTLANEGTKFSEVIELLRVREARRLLENTALTVTEIGYICGFADTSHFCRRFKLNEGVSPSAFREKD